MAPKTPNAQEAAIADIEKPIATEIPSATGPLFVDLPDMALVIKDPGIKPSKPAISKVPKVMTTSVNTCSPIDYFNGLTIIETWLK